jgi:repressor LexA
VSRKAGLTTSQVVIMTSKRLGIMVHSTYEGGQPGGEPNMTSADVPSQSGRSQRISPRQVAILQYIRESVQRRGYPPSLREIAQAVGLASQSTVSHHLSALVKKGYLSRGPGLPRTTVELPSGQEAAPAAAGEAGTPPARPDTPPAKPDAAPAEPDAGPARADLDRPVPVPLIGRIAAGVPITAQQEVEDTFLLPRKIVGHGTLFMLRVAGDSMINAGITDGDYVIIRQQDKVTSGDIVAALIDGIEYEATVKTYQQAEDGQCWLMAHNPAYAPIPGDSAEIMGKVVAVLRRTV